MDKSRIGFKGFVANIEEFQNSSASLEYLSIVGLTHSCAGYFSCIQQHKIEK